MKIFRLAAMIAVVAAAGCITVERYSFRLDGEDGMVERGYHNLRSRRGPDETAYSIEGDWNSLRGLVAETDPEFDPAVVEDLEKELFEEDGVLSGRKRHRVLCPQCFPSKADLLAYLHDEDWRFEDVNGEVFLFLPAGKRAISSNGKVISTEKNSMIVWSGETNVFAYEVAETASIGEPLLPFYLGKRSGDATNAVSGD